MRPRSMVAIIGAGTLGGSLAHKLAVRDRVNEIRLIDDAYSVAAGKSLDIRQAGAVERWGVNIVPHQDLAAAVGATAIVLAGPATTTDDEWDEARGLELLARIASLDRRAVIVCAGASHRRLVERGVSDTGLPRHRLIGSAPYGFESALRAIVAVELRCAASQVSLTVLGTPPDGAVVPWSQATVRGLAISHAVEPPRLAKLRQKVPRLWPPGPYTLASAATRVLEAIVDATDRRALPCFVVLDGEVGIRGKAAAMPVEIGAQGVSRVIEPRLSVQERVLLENALLGGGGRR